MSLRSSDFRDDNDHEDDLQNTNPLRSCSADFEEITRIGSGSFGTVMKVKRKQDGGIYVIKSVKIHELSKKEQFEAINEVDLLAKMDSFYVVKYFDSFIEKGCLRIVMEFCNKGDLQKMIKRAQKKELSSLGEYTTWHIVLQILLGLHYLHNMKVLHRDMKSANVFLMKDPSHDFYRVKIGDLGVAKVLDSSTAFAQSLVGTPYYLSPELCADMPYRDKSDVWAFGVILYECCMLAHPFEARNQCALIMKIVQVQMAPISSEVPTALNEFITWILQKDPKDRPKIREILNDRYIRQKLEEHEFEVPEDLLHNQITDRIGMSNSSMLSPSSVSLTMTVKSKVVQQDEAEEETRKFAFARSNDQTTVLTPQPHKKPNPAPSPRGNELSTRSNEVRGTRVRSGRADAKLTSQKAREIHQIKAPPPSLTKQKIPQQDLDHVSESKHDITMASYHDGRRGSKQNAFDWDEAKKRLDEIAEKQNGHYDDPPQSDHEDEDQDDEAAYENDNDFEPEDFSADTETSNRGNNFSILQGEGILDSSQWQPSGKIVNEQSGSWKMESIQSPDQKERKHMNTLQSQQDYKSDLRRTIAKQLDSDFLSNLDDLTQLTHAGAEGHDDDDDDTGTVDPNELHENSALWKSLWSQGRGILNTNRHVDSDDLSDEEDDEGKEDHEDGKNDQETITQQEKTRRKSEVISLSRARKIKLLEGLIHDTKVRSQNKLGDELFIRVYDLLSSMMYAPVSKTEDAEDSGISDLDRSELQELECVLSERFNGAKELMCEVVFDIKKLLAIESSLDRLLSSHKK